LYGIKFDVIFNGNKFITAIPENFREKIKSTAVKTKVDNKIVSKVISEKFNLYNKKLLYLTGAVVEDDFIEELEFIDKNDKFLTLIENEYGKKVISLKMHPRFSKFYSKENEFDNINKNIPANLIINSYKIIIGYDSSTLFETANNNVLSVSLLNYFTPTSNKTKKTFIKYLNDNLKPGKKIYFPENIEQLKKIFKNDKYNIT